MPSLSPREALLLELEGRLLEEAGASDEASSDPSAAELAWELELDECDELDAGRLLELLLELPELLDEGRLLLELSVSSLDELPEEAWLLLEEGRLLLPAPEAEELLPELEEEAEASSEGSSGVLDAPEELPEELEELPEDAPLELLEPEELEEELSAELDEPDELLELLELEEPVPMPLSNETVRVLLTTWLSL